MEWIKNKIRQYRQYKAKKEAWKLNAERVRREQQEQQRAIDSEWLKWRLARSYELRREILAEWKAALDTDVTSQCDIAVKEFLHWRDVVSEQGEIKLESIEKLSNGVRALESRSKKNIEQELDQQIGERLNFEEASMKYACRIANIERLRSTYGDFWANNQLYMIHPGLCPLTDRIKIRRCIRKKRQKAEAHEYLLKSAISLVIGILLLPLIFILWGTWKWNH